jgi:hypothetical protein
MDRVTTVGQGRGSRLDLRCKHPGLFVFVAQQVSIIVRIVFAQLRFKRFRTRQAPA